MPGIRGWWSAILARERDRRQRRSAGKVRSGAAPLRLGSSARIDLPNLPEVLHEVENQQRNRAPITP